jgi:fused signal recognition particle receptor
MEGQGFFRSLRKGLERTRGAWVPKLQALFLKSQWTEDVVTDMEELLITADVGMKATRRLLDSMERQSRQGGGDSPQGFSLCLQREMVRLLTESQSKSKVSTRCLSRPWVVMFVGVNGVGKTTTIGKLAEQHKRNGKTVLLAAADTFRAGAIEQLEIWGHRVGADVIKHQAGQDPSGVAFDAIAAAKKRNADIVLIDTAGRLHTKTPLLEELRKMRRVIERELAGAPHETLLVLDAPTGQNGLQQAKVFKESLGITGVVLTKLDGTAKGGVVVGIQQELEIPVEYIGIGEGVNDLQPFDPAGFVQALFA